MRPAAFLIVPFVVVLPAIDARAQAPAAGTPPVVVQQFSCRADGSAWRLDATRGSAVLRREPGKGPRELVFRGEMLAVPSAAPPTSVWRGQSTHLPAETLVATLREETCRPPGTDAGASQPWRAVVSSRAGEALTACCTVRSGYDLAKAPLADFAKKSDGDWARRYPEVFPAMRRCLSDAGFAVAHVVHAVPTTGDGAVVQLEAADGKRWTCSTGSRMSRPVYAAASAPAGGPDQPVFLPAREAGPIVSCGRLERVPVPGSRVRTEGWLHYDRKDC